jgi:hypothetical protein
MMAILMVARMGDEADDCWMLCLSSKVIDKTRRDRALDIHISRRRPLVQPIKLGYEVRTLPSMCPLVYSSAHFNIIIRIIFTSYPKECDSRIEKNPHVVLANPLVRPNRFRNLSTNFSVRAYVRTFANPTNCVVACNACSQIGDFPWASSEARFAMPGIQRRIHRIGYPFSKRNLRSSLFRLMRICESFESMVEMAVAVVWPDF